MLKCIYKYSKHATNGRDAHTHAHTPAHLAGHHMKLSRDVLTTVSTPSPRIPTPVYITYTR